MTIAQVRCRTRAAATPDARGPSTGAACASGCWRCQLRGAPSTQSLGSAPTARSPSPSLPADLNDACVRQLLVPQHSVTWAECTEHTRDMLLLANLKDAGGLLLVVQKMGILSCQIAKRWAEMHYLCFYLLFPQSMNGRT